MKKAKIWFVLLFISIGAQAQNVDDILARHFKTTGGMAKWKKLKSMKLTGMSSTQQGDFPVTMYRKAPNKLKVVVTVQDKEIVAQACDGVTAWALNPFIGPEPTRMDEATTRVLKEEYLEDDFIDYRKKGHKVTLEGIEEIDSVKCYKIKLIKNGTEDREGIVETHYFNTENYLLVLQKTVIPSGPYQGSEANTYLSDYREVNGLTIPFIIEQKVQGNSVFKVIVEKIEINSDLEDAIFAFEQN